MTSLQKTYTNYDALLNVRKTNIEAVHKRLQRLYPCVDDVGKLPQAWSQDKSPRLGLTQDKLGCYFRGNARREDDDQKSAAAVRTDNYIHPSCLLYYFEVKIISKGREGCMGVGLTSCQVLLTKPLGWARDSYGYHADDGHSFSGDGRGHPYGPTFTTGDVIGCGYNLVEGKCFFTKNGLNLGKAFEDIPSNTLLYPTIGLKTHGEEIIANFGQEDFVYDIQQELRSLRKNMTLTISNYPISDFSTWQSTMHKLVQSWLLENSYPETADAFTRHAKIECKENLQRVHQRNRIQKLVLNGKISEAIRLTNRLCPNLLQNEPSLLFALKCRQFIELIGGAENEYQPSNINLSSSDYVTASENTIDDGGNGAQKCTDNGDHIANSSQTANNNVKSSNGFNHGTIACNNRNDGCKKIEAQRPGSSSSSLQELMDIDQPVSMTAANDANDNHRIASTQLMTNNVHNHATQQITTTLTNNDTVNRVPQHEAPDGTLAGTGMDDDEKKFGRLLQFGRELREHLQQLESIYGKNEANEKMLRDAVSLIAFIDPYSSSFGKLLDPKEREPLSQMLNSSIVKAETGESYRTPLEGMINHLRKLVKLNDSQGRWLIDQLL